MDSITRSSFPESPARSSRSQLSEQVDPDARQQAESGVDRPKSMPDMNAGLPASSQTSITDRVVTASDASATNPGDSISQTKPADFSVLYPKLDQLIKNLKFVPNDDIGRFAFACGLYPEYCEIKTTTYWPQRRAAFFQKYFEIEGSDAGIIKLQLFNSCDIFYRPNQEKLSAVLENIDVEYLPGAPVKTVNSDFDFQLAFKHVANKMGVLDDFFARRLGFKQEELEEMISRMGNREARSDTMIVLDNFAQRGGRTVDLLKPLVDARRTDLKEKLAKALDEKVADLSAGSAPKKAKYDSGQ